MLCSDKAVPSMNDCLHGALLVVALTAGAGDGPAEGALAHAYDC
jgi:hypothetical protein